MGTEKPEPKERPENGPKAGEVAEPAKLYISSLEERLDENGGPQSSEYTDEQFEADLKLASGALEALAEKARQALKMANSQKFPS